MGGEEGADGGGAHEGGDAGEIDDAGFAGTFVRGCDRGGREGFPFFRKLGRDVDGGRFCRLCSQCGALP